MRVHVTPLHAEISAGIAQSITVSISNTETIIAGYAVRILGADPGWVELEAESISLFPDETRTLGVSVDPPAGIPAGSRRIAVQVRELTPPYETTITEVELTVPAAAMVQLRVDPVAVTAGKRASFSLLVENTGNTDIKGYLSGDDPESKVRFAFEPERVTLPPAQHLVVDMQVAARRRFFGTPTVRPLSLYLEPVPDDAFFNPDAPAALRNDDREVLASATFVQKSVMARGALSLLGLLFAATVFAIVITIALSRLVAQSTADRNLALQVAAARQSPAMTGTSGVAGTVILLTSGKPVAGVGVSVFTTSNTTTPVATTATNSVGAYRVGDLAAGDYKLSFRGAGFVQLWYPRAADVSDATTVTLATGQVKAGVDVALGGVPATISGSVVGDDVSAATLFVMTVPKGAAPAAAAAPESSTPGQVTPPDNGGAVVQHVPIGSDGSFALSNVPSPSVYDLVVVKAGYATSTQRINVGAGEARTGVQITLSKGDGLINGTVSSGSGALSGATVTASSGQTRASTVSLTGANAGSFTLRSLPTPGTFTVVVSKPGYAAQTLTLSLATGQKLTGVGVTLTRSSASLAGVVTVVPAKLSAGGVSVTVTDGKSTVQTATESTQHPGSWQVGGLPIPGTYTVTFSRSDLQSQTVSVSLDATGQVIPGSLGTRVTAAGVAVTMQSATATVSGLITQPGGGNVCDPSTDALGEATVSLRSGSTTYAETTASVAPNCGTYRLERIPPGTYTLTVSATSGTTPRSQVITVTAGESLVRNVALHRPASMSGTVRCCTAGADAQSGPRQGWTVFLYAETGYPSTVLRTTTTDAEGHFKFDDIDANRYIVATGPTSDPSNATATVEVTVQPSAARTGVTILVDR